MSHATDFGFLTSHARVLLCLARNPQARMRDVASFVGITERAVQRVVRDLEASGYLDVSRQGRRNVYALETRLPLRHPAEGARTIAALLTLVRAESSPPPPRDVPVRIGRPLESFID